MPIGDSYDALMKGVVEAILVPVEGLKQWKLFEVTSFVTENFGSAYTTTFFCVMNKNKWDSLPLNIQKIIEQVNIEWIEKTGKLWDEMDKEGKTFSISNGIKFIPLSKEEDTRWTATVKPMLDEYVKRMREKKLPGDEALKFALDYLKNQNNNTK
jgi:TRAP-type C4-dicarboxylate transport system substrate-binding protein